MAETRPCPDKARLLIRGEHYPCDAMRGMTPYSDTHDGWPHTSQAAGAVWGSASAVQRETGLHIHPAVTSPSTCVCGEVPWEPNLRSRVADGVVHRAGGPCYVEDAAAQAASGRYESGADRG